MPRAEAPLIDGRKYSDLVADIEELSQTYTAGPVAKHADLLAGAVLDQPVEDPGTGETFPAGTLVSRGLAEQLAGIQDLGQVRVKGWQPVPGQVRVEPTLANLVGAVLGEDLQETQDHTIPRWTAIDEATAQRILAIPGLSWVWLDLQPDAGWALARVFSRMAELVVTRLNRLPDRNYLAFLDLIGSRLNPPQPARVPLTFLLAAGSPTDALVPAGTQAAATALEGEAEAPVFETERDLVVARSQLTAVYTREPGRDLWADHTAVATGQAAGAFQPFRGDRPIEHRLHVTHPLLGLPEEKTVELRISPAAERLPWLSAVTWECWNGTAWHTLDPYVFLESTPQETWVVEFEGVPGIAASAVHGIDGFWLRGSLKSSLALGEVVPVGQERELRRRGIRPAAGFTETAGLFTPVDLTRPFFPFGEDPPVQILYLSTGTDFTKPGSWIEIDIALDPAQPPEPTIDLAVAWEIWNGEGWQAVATDFIPVQTLAEGEEVDAFLVDGRVRFRRPEVWSPVTVAGVHGFWLRARITQGSFGASPDDHPPLVRSLTLGDDWTLPRIDSLSVRVEAERNQDLDEDIVPERGFANQVPLDLSKDFLPFGEKPKVGDAFYLANDEAFSKPGNKVKLYINLTPGAPLVASGDLMLTWEFWNGREWQLLGSSGNEGESGAGDFQDDSDTGTDGFRQSGRVRFTVPPSLVPTMVNGEVRHWVRARISRGNYGVEAKYVPVVVDGEPQYDRGLPVYELVPATFGPPSLSSLRLGYFYDSEHQPPQHVWTENDFAFADVTLRAAVGPGTFLPFVPSEDQRSTLYLGFERPGDAIGFANRATALFFQVADALYDPGVEQGAVTEEASIVWEYWNGEFWERLGTRDETRGLTRRGLVTFIGPPDFRASSELGRTAFWLRGRWERGEYAVEPQLVRVLPNTMWAVHAQTIRGEVLGSSRGERGQVFRTLRAPVLDGQQLEVVEPEIPSGADLVCLEGEEGDGAVTAVHDASGRFVEVRVRWHEVPDFYGSGPRSRHYVLDHATGEVRFGDGRRGLIPPPGRNNVRMVRYRAGGGLAGNRPAGNIAQLKGTVPYIGGVVQHVPAEGGAAEESLEAVRVRGPKTLRHRDRAAAAADFEDLAFQASSQVARAQALPARSGPEGGQVGLIVVPSGEAAKPVPSLELLTRVRSYIEARLSPVVDFWVVGPDWLQLDVRAEVVPQQLEAATDVQTAVLERLRAFLHPLSGGPKGEGWEFGRKPYRSDLYALIEETPGVDHVRRLELIETPREGGARAGRFLVFSGDHEITLSGNVDEAADPGSLS